LRLISGKYCSILPRSCSLFAFVMFMIFAFAESFSPPVSLSINSLAIWFHTFLCGQ
jgi:hypothetical protein